MKVNMASLRVRIGPRDRKMQSGDDPWKGPRYAIICLDVFHVGRGTLRILFLGCHVAVGPSLMPQECSKAIRPTLGTGGPKMSHQRTFHRIYVYTSKINYHCSPDLS